MIATKIEMFKIIGKSGIITAIIFCSGSAFGQDPAKKDSASTIPAEAALSEAQIAQIAQWCDTIRTKP